MVEFVRHDDEFLIFPVFHGYLFRGTDSSVFCRSDRYLGILTKLGPDFKIGFYVGEYDMVSQGACCDLRFRRFTVCRILPAYDAYITRIIAVIRRNRKCLVVSVCCKYIAEWLNGSVFPCTGCYMVGFGRNGFDSMALSYSGKRINYNPIFCCDTFHDRNLINLDIFNLIAVLRGKWGRGYRKNRL